MVELVGRIKCDSCKWFNRDSLTDWTKESVSLLYMPLNPVEEELNLKLQCGFSNHSTHSLHHASMLSEVMQETFARHTLLFLPLKTLTLPI